MKLKREEQKGVEKIWGYPRLHRVLANNGDGFSPVFLKQFQFMKTAFKCCSGLL